MSRIYIQSYNTTQKEEMAAFLTALQILTLLGFDSSVNKVSALTYTIALHAVTKK